MSKILRQQAVFFELDGVIVREPKLGSDDRPSYYDGALEALARLPAARFQLFVATSREDIALGLLKERDFRRFCDRFVSDLKELGIELTNIYHCPFHPKGRGKWKKDSVFRKPAPGIFKMAQQEYDLNLNRSWMIGHTTLDVLAASRAGMGTVLVQTGQAGKDGTYQIDPHFVEADIRHAVARITMFEHALTV